MSDRLDQLAMRRRQLLLRSERLRTDLAADNKVLLHALGGVDRAFSMAKSVAPKILLVAGGALLLRMFRRSRPAAHAGFAMKALFWVSMARRMLPYVTLLRGMWKSRSRQRPDPADIAQSAQ
jgi:hypothetical protein